MLKQLRPALVSFLLLTVVTGVIYPAIVTGLAHALFPREAVGSVIERDGNAVGSRLIGQSFTRPEYFWPRPSATTPTAYNAAAGTGSNLAPSNPDLAKQVSDRVAALRLGGNSNALVPVDLVTASASGLDPDISVAAARFQIARVAQARHRPIGEIEALVNQSIQGRTVGLLGEPRVNVLLLNLELDRSAPRVSH